MTEIYELTITNEPDNINVTQILNSNIIISSRNMIPEKRKIEQ